MADLELSPPVFAIFSSLIEERVGLCYPLQDAEILASKLSLRALELGFGTLLDYYYFLRYDAGSEQEFTALVNTLVVNETFFFRELLPLKVMVSELIAPLVHAGKSPRIWSAACSTGEEPLTLAMLLEEQGLLGSVELIATDVSSNALGKARSGTYGKRSLRQVLTPRLVEKWLQVGEHSISVRPELLSRVSFRQLNLLDSEAVEALGRFDLILCRNVLIYFRDVTATRVVNTLASQLNPRGVLLVGISESLLRFRTELSCEESSGVFLYRKGGS